MKNSSIGISNGILKGNNFGKFSSSVSSGDNIFQGDFINEKKDNLVLHNGYCYKNK